MSLYVSLLTQHDDDLDGKFLDVAYHLGDGHVRLSVGNEDARIDSRGALILAQAILEAVKRGTA